MTISERNKQQGWTPELVVLAKKWQAEQTNYRDLDEIVSSTSWNLVEGKPYHGIVLGELPADLAELVQALPGEALEVMNEDGKWEALACCADRSHVEPGTRRLDKAYRVEEDWEVGEYVEWVPEAVVEPKPVVDYVFTEQDETERWRLLGISTTRRWALLCDAPPEANGGYQFCGFVSERGREKIEGGQADSAAFCMAPYIGGPDGIVKLPYAVWRKVVEWWDREVE